MKFNKIYGEAFLTLLSPFVFYLKDRGLVLIQGENKVDSSATSNGAGKSSLVDAISWAIYGYTARGLSGDAVVNSKVKKGCEVAIEIEDDHAIYTITRKRKPASLRVEVLDKLSKVAADLTKGTEKETQELITRIMGCSLEVFLAAIYAGQEQMPDLPGMTDKQLKTLVEQAAGTDQLTAGYAVARGRLIKATTELQAAEKGRDAIEDAIRLLKINHDNARNEADVWAKENTETIAAILASATAHKAGRDETDRLIAGMAEADKLAELDRIKKALSSWHDTNKKIEGLQAEIATAERAHNTAVDAVDKVKASIASEEANLLHLETHDDTCPTCAAPVSPEKRQAQVDAVKAKAAKLRDTLLPDVVAKATKRYADLQDLMTQLTGLVTGRAKPEELLARQETLGESLVELTRLKGIQSSYTVALSAAATDLKKRRESVNPHLSYVEGTQRAIEGKDIEMLKQIAYIEALQKRLKVLEDAVQVLGPAGARAQILDTVTPQLNKSTAEYLGAMSDGAISALWSTLSTTAKGELREKFNIEVNNINGGESFESISGGEKRKVRLACYMAMQDLVATRAGKPIDLFVADEIDHALDPAGLERLMAILEQKARERGTVLVVSHNSLSDWIDNVVTVVKTDAKTSHLEGAIA